MPLGRRTALAAAVAAALSIALLPSLRDAAAVLRPPQARNNGTGTPRSFPPGREPFSRPRVGLQPGHWLMELVPDELKHLRANTGTAAAGIAEVDLNRKVAALVAEELRRDGILVDLLPATVPEGYRADAFLAIHADGNDNGARGWKIASPWRPSPASEGLRRALEAAYAAPGDLPEDRVGITIQMRGYYAFGWSRYRHAVAPDTPSAIVETGYLTSAEDRRVIVADPASVARRLAAGIRLFLGGRLARPASAYAPRTWPSMTVTAPEAEMRAWPGREAPVWDALPGGTVVQPLDERDGWFQVWMRPRGRTLGWIRAEDLAPGGG